MKTFNIDLWQNLRNIIIDEEEGTKFLDGKIYFGLAPEDTPAPYCVMHVMDSGNDDTSATLCKNDEGYNMVGESDIQFNMYATNDMQLDELLQEFNLHLNKLKNLTDYRVITSIRGTTKNASSFTGEVGLGFTRYSFKFEKL